MWFGMWVCRSLVLHSYKAFLLHSPHTHTHTCSGELEVDVDQNSTWVQLSPLDPGSAYLVAVAGVNSNGVGKFSEYQTVMTLSPEGQCRNGNMNFFLSIHNTKSSFSVILED